MLIKSLKFLKLNKIRVKIKFHFLLILNKKFINVIYILWIVKFLKEIKKND